MKWFGHVVRMQHHRLPLQAYKNYFTQRRPPGRPPTRWRDQMLGDLRAPLQEAGHQAQGRTEWRRMTRKRGTPRHMHLSQVSQRDQVKIFSKSANIRKKEKNNCHSQLIGGLH